MVLLVNGSLQVVKKPGGQKTENIGGVRDVFWFNQSVANR